MFECLLSFRLHMLISSYKFSPLLKINSCVFMHNITCASHNANGNVKSLQVGLISIVLQLVTACHISMRVLAQLAVIWWHRCILVIFLQTVPLQSIMHELDESFILSKGTVWRDMTDIYM